MTKVFHVVKHVEMEGDCYIRAESEEQAENKACELDIAADDDVDGYYEVDEEYDEDDLPNYINREEIFDLED